MYEQSGPSAWLWARVVGARQSILIASAASLAGVWLLIAIDALLLAMLGIERCRVEVAHRLLPVSLAPTSGRCRRRRTH